MSVIDITQHNKNKIVKCKKCNNKINPNDTHAYDYDDNRVCLSCFFDKKDVTIICEVKMYCNDCLQRIGEECGIDGHEVYDDTEACGWFEPIEQI